ncbi:LysR family transcriptional regulator [Streptomyces sp. MMG1121]|uniref:LysR family transcriptional regulator n=1 Tax=Streptomyces sp. MMG1121 TaxID=1415544 RepID=UPI00099BE508|nr:LysR family transcriptional regulator [Streptomyces sp. MMG1121]
MRRTPAGVRYGPGSAAARPGQLLRTPPAAHLHPGDHYPTLTEACQTHGLNPATLTMQLKRLEEDLGGPLLLRASRGRKLELTALGREVVQAVESWACTLADLPRETWDRATVRRPHKKKRKPRRPADASGVDRFPALVQPAVRTFDGRRRLLRLLQAVDYPSLAAYCRAVGTSPSTMTVQLQHLERDLRGQLLIRGQCGHRMRLTDFGKEVLAAAGPLAALLGDGHRRTASTSPV